MKGYRTFIELEKEQTDCGVSIVYEEANFGCPLYLYVILNRLYFWIDYTNHKSIV